MSIEGQGHFFTIYFPGFVCFVLYLAKISGERLQDHWSSGIMNCHTLCNLCLVVRKVCIFDQVRFKSSHTARDASQTPGDQMYYNILATTDKDADQLRIKYRCSAPLHFVYTRRSLLHDVDN